jgi:fructose-bisphosphate aldolase / 6-deoxy-5-ketofructose 1-phosphate synthase
MMMKQLQQFTDANQDVCAILSTLVTGAQQIRALLQQVNRNAAGTTNATGDAQLACDVAADKLLFQLFWDKRLVKEYASEERETIIPINPTAAYSVTVDPLDGSSLLDVNLAVGTILGIWKGGVMTGELVAAAYVVYGPTTEFVFSAGNGTHDCLITENGLRLLEENIQMNQKGKIYSIGGLRSKWVDRHRDFVHALENTDYKLRYGGCFVTEVHQILIKKGGVFSYPILVDNPKGKLRVLFELYPLAFLIEQAGGSATDGEKRILDLERTAVHQRSAIYLGSKQEVALAGQYISGVAAKESDTIDTTKETGGDTMQTLKTQELKKLTEADVIVPADVPEEMKATYIKNFLECTKHTGRMFLYAGDQKIEHLNDDFYGHISSGPIPLDDAEPEHLFRIAQQAKQHYGFFTAQYGMIARYGRKYNDVPYLVKMNSKTHLVKTKNRDPVSLQLVDFNDVLALQKNSGLNIVGVGYTIYVGSRFEREMFAEAGRLIAAAHRQGMMAVLWMYPRGSSVADEKDPHIIAGAAGVACTLGADFVKVSYPKHEEELSEEVFKEAVLAAGNTGVITSGGSSMDVRAFLDRLHKQLHVSGCVGNATGRNVHQKTLHDAVRMCAAVAAVTYGNKDVEYAMKVYNGKEVFQL